MATVTFKTSLGQFTLEINENLCPITAKNFLHYCTSGFYKDTIFHRVIGSFMIQGGGLLSNMSSKATQASIKNEADLGLENVVGTIAMARTSDPHSATCQFFINVNDNSFLNFKAKNNSGWGYCAFGAVTSGMDVVEKISKVKTVTVGDYQDTPEDPIVIEDVIVTNVTQTVVEPAH